MCAVRPPAWHCSLRLAPLLQWVVPFSGTPTDTHFYASSAWPVLMVDIQLTWGEWINHVIKMITRATPRRKKVKDWLGSGVSGRQAWQFWLPQLGCSPGFPHSPPLCAPVPVSLTPPSPLPWGCPGQGQQRPPSHPVQRQLLALTCCTPGLPVACLFCCRTWLSPLQNTTLPRKKIWLHFRLFFWSFGGLTFLPSSLKYGDIFLELSSTHYSLSTYSSWIKL